MASPQVRTVEYDLSIILSPFEGMNGLLLGNFDRGRVGERMFISTPRQADLMVGTPGPNSDHAYYILHSYLTKSKRCYAVRVANSSLYGGLVLGSSYNTELGTGNGVVVTFSGTLQYGRCLPSSVEIWVDDQKRGYDNGSGEIQGTYLASGTVVYKSGTVTVTFDSDYPPPVGSKVYARWGFPHQSFDTIGVDAETYADPTTYDFTNRLITLEIDHTTDTYSDILPPYPLIAPGTVATVNDATLTIKDGTTVIAYADESGVLQDTASYLGIGTVEVTTVECLAASTLSGGEYFTINSPADVQFAFWYEKTGLPEISTVTCLGSSTLTTGDYFTIHTTTTDYAVWYNVASGAGEPTVAGHTLVPVVVGAADADTVVATATAAAIHAVTGFTSGAVDALVTITNDTLGAVTAIADNNTGFTVATTQEGVDTTGSAPTVAGATVTKIAVGTLADADAVATASQAIIDAEGTLTAATTDDLITISNSVIGVATDGVDVDTGFDIIITQQGAPSTNTVNYSNGTLAFTLDSGYTPASALTVTYSSAMSDYAMVYADNQGDWSDKTAVVIEAVDIVNNQFNITVWENRFVSGRWIEQKTGDTYFVSKEEKIDGYSIQMYMPDRINDKSNYLRVLDNLNVEASDAMPSVSMTHANYLLTSDALDYMDGGDNGLALTPIDYVDDLMLFNNKEDVDIDIVIDTVGHPTYQTAIANLCDRERGGRGDCYGVLYTPKYLEESTNYIVDLIQYRKYSLNLNTSFCGLYTGHVLITDTYNGRKIFIPPSGFVAAAFSYTADQFEPWWAAAGWRRGILPVEDVFRRFTLGERDELYDEDINVMRHRPGWGIAIWGQRTLYPVWSALKSANVRWLLITVEKAGEEFLEYQEFEINDDITRAITKAAFEAYYDGIKNRRGVYAFEIVCSTENNTPDVISALKMFVDVYIQPSLVAEYIYQRVIITRTGVDFGDVRLEAGNLD